MLNIPNPDAYNAAGTHTGQNNSGHGSQETKQDKLNRLLDTRNKIAEAMKTNITFSHPILKQNDKAVFYPKTINVIQGKAGVHKSRLAETICSALLSGPGNSKDLLGFKKDPLTRYVVVYVDTERNLSEQLPYALQQIKLKAGYQIEESITDFDWVSLLEFDRESRFEMLDIFLEYVREEYNIHIFIVLDVITDCVFNFNDTKDSMKLIDMMNKSINRFDVTFLCLIHENPGNTDKARGHLGTEILNKASTVIQISFEKDKDQHAMELIKISYLKCRNSKKHDPFYVQYAEEQKARDHTFKPAYYQSDACIKEQIIEISLREKTSRIKKETQNGWGNMYDYKENGLLIIKIDKSYRCKEFIDGKMPLEKQLSLIIASLEILAIKELEWKEECRKRREEDERKKKIRLEFEKRQDEDLKAFRETLNKAERWHKAENLRNYINEVESKAISGNNLTEETKAWLTWARKKAEWYDPFIEADNELLKGADKETLSFNRKPSYW